MRDAIALVFNGKSGMISPLLVGPFAASRLYHRPPNAPLIPVLGFMIDSPRAFKIVSRKFDASMSPVAARTPRILSSNQMKTRLGTVLRRGLKNARKTLFTILPFCASSKIPGRPIHFVTSGCKEPQMAASLRRNL
jgi:hypothetical protein